MGGGFAIAACFMELAEPSENPMKVPRVGNHPLDTRCIDEMLEDGNRGIRHACPIERTPHTGIDTHCAHLVRPTGKAVHAPKFRDGKARTAFRQGNVGRRPLSLPRITAALGRVFDVVVVHP
jgi:hypothetical protein